MEKMMKKLSDSIVDKVSMDFLRNQVLKNAYGNDDTFIARRDPRILLVWYLYLADHLLSFVSFHISMYMFY